MHHIPNIISVLRILLIIPIGIMLQRELWLNAFVLILIAGLSDALDGFLARVFNWQSHLGSILDPLADKALLILIFMSLAEKGMIPLWLAVLVVSRDIIILFGAIAYQWMTNRLEMSPLFTSKINTALQILFVLLIMYHLAFATIAPLYIDSLQIAVAFTTVVSGLAYIMIWLGYTKKALNNKRQNKI